MAPILTKEAARTFYDRLGARQDTQAFYEDPATAVLIAHAAFDKAEAMFEFGCGTGRFTGRIFETHLSARCTYRAVDISPTMVRLAGARLGRWGGRAEVALTDGSTALDAP
ncbi:MAG: class I SAM-dependent methyltransferase, partial [Paracoccaceae bacterium]